jgi:hypothetical protein
LRAIVDVERDDVGRLIGKITCPRAGSRSFCVLVELVGVIEAGFDDEDWLCWMSFPNPPHPWDLREIEG